MTESQEKAGVLGTLLPYLEIVVGGALSAACMGFFVIPQHFAAGGVTGLSVILESLLPVKLSVIVLILNVILFILGWILVGRKFIMKTFILTLLYPLMLEFYQHIHLFDVMGKDPLLSAVIGAVILGVGSGLVLRGGGSGGGFDILGVICYKYFKVPVSLVMYICDCTVIIIQAVMSQSVMKTVYGIIVILLGDLLVNKVLTYGRSESQMIILSEKYEDIRMALLVQQDVGMTFLNAESGYKRHDLKVILAIVPYGKIEPIRKQIQSIDRTAFVVVSDVHSVSGRGFTLGRTAADEPLLYGGKTENGKESK